MCHVQLTQPQVELLLQIAPALQDTSELHRMTQRLDVLVSQITVCLVGGSNTNLQELKQETYFLVVYRLQTDTFQQSVGIWPWY